jgi:hypothetical protein
VVIGVVAGPVDSLGGLPEDKGAHAGDEVVGKPISKPVAASSRAADSGGSRMLSACRLSSGWSSRRTPRIGWTAREQVIVQASAT